MLVHVSALFSFYLHGMKGGATKVIVAPPIGAREI